MGACSCVYVGDYDQPSCSNQTIRQAVKPHECCECKRVIGVGEKYEVISGMWDGHFSTYKTCKDCLSIRDEFFCEGYFFGQVLEYLREYLDECNGKIPAKCLLSLTPDAMSRVCGMIDKIWEELEESDG